MGRAIRPARCDLNQIYEYAVKVMNRFKGLDLVNSEPEEPQMRSVILHRRQ